MGAKERYSLCLLVKVYASGLCFTCSKPRSRHTPIILCKECFFKNASKRLFGTVKHWASVMELCKKHKYKCYYTGMRLRIGVNMSFDHRIPLSHRDAGQSVRQIENIVPCHIATNIAKGGLSEADFVQMCKLVAKHRKNKKSKRSKDEKKPNFCKKPIFLQSDDGWQEEETPEVH